MDPLVVLVYCWFKPAAVLSALKEFKVFKTLFCKSYYPALISCSFSIEQKVSTHCSMTALCEEFLSEENKNSQILEQIPPE